LGRIVEVPKVTESTSGLVRRSAKNARPTARTEVAPKLEDDANHSVCPVMDTALLENIARA